MNEVQGDEDSAIDKKKMDDAMRNEIVEYLLKGIRASFVAYTNAKHGEESSEEERGFMSSFFKRLYGFFCRHAKDEEAEYESKKSLMLESLRENNSNLKRLNLIESHAIKKEAVREQTFNLSLDSQKIDNEFIYEHHDAPTFGSGIRFVSLGQKVFQNLRVLHDISDDDILSLFTRANLLQRKLKVKLQSGKGGAFFILPEKGKYLIKSINNAEYHVMKTILAELYMHYLTYKNSYINPIYGCYALYLSEGNEIEPQYFILMKNVLDLTRENLPESSEILCFDIKGSSAGRRALSDPKVLVEKPIDKEIQKETLKDQDFMMSFKKVNVSEQQSKQVLQQLERDANFFSKYLLIDFSLLLFVLNIPYKSYTSMRKGDIRKAGHELGEGSLYRELILAELQLKPSISRIVFEERDREINAIYNVNNQKDVILLKKIDDQCNISKLVDKFHQTAQKEVKESKQLKVPSIETTLK